MFNPSREQVRRFFLDAWDRQRRGEPLSGLEPVAVDLMHMHPEYHAMLDDPDAAARDFSVEDGAMNPFLHLSLHLAIEEQLGIDQPPGIRALLDRLASKLGERHAALHVALDCLGETVWRAQRDNAPPDALAYLECVKRRL